ncbi:MAG: hypothetical protein ACPIOQ_33885 [Promethearchaeia archaeon]
MLTLDDGNHGTGQVVQMIKGEPNTEVILTIEAAQAKTTGMTNYA